MTNEFFTWAVLLTYAGATLATSLVTQLIKGVGFIDKIPTRLTSYIIALVVLVAATFFTSPLNWALFSVKALNTRSITLGLAWAKLRAAR